MTEFEVVVMIVDDEVVEDIESFFLMAELVSDDAPGVVIAPDMSTVTINDEDSKLV